MLKKIAAQFIPIVIIFASLSFSKDAVLFSHTILGKLIAVSIIMFYTFVDKTLGLFVCLLIIFYYQYSIMENMLNIEDVFDVNENIEHTLPLDEAVDDYLFFEPTKQEKKLTKKNKNKPLSAKDEFRKKNCKGSDLYYNNIKIRPDVADSVFPELKFNDTVCNPCNDVCDVAFVEKKINIETILLPITTKP